MKKNLNIAYLNGAEGMIRRGVSGGSGESGGEASSIEYLDVSGSGMATLMLSYSLEAKLSRNSGTNVMIATSLTVYQMLVELGSDYDYLLVKIDINGATCVKNGSDVTTANIGDLLTQVGIDVNSFPRITKEEFYAV